jgi:thymidylate synthase (FAD)
MGVDGSDITPATAARTSYRDFVDAHSDQQNVDLVDYLIRKQHATPIEFASATFYMIMPIFVARQLVRHRTASINEESLRYIEAREEFWVPSVEECKTQSTTNKQGSSSNLVEDPAYCQEQISNSAWSDHAVYESLLSTGLSREVSRTVLPLGTYTAWYWKANLRNVFHLLQLRLDEHAQVQCRVYAQAMLEMLKPYFPKTIEAWENHVLNAVTFSADEWKAVKAALEMLKFRELEGFTGYALEYAHEVCGLRKTRLQEFRQKLMKEVV